jgi:membrane protein DedA with SNARE-associated domain
VNAPAAPAKGPLAAIGRTLAVLSHLGLSILWWLLYIAAGALVGAGTLYVIARRRGVKLGLKGLIAAWKEALSSLLSRRRAPR